MAVKGPKNSTLTVNSVNITAYVDSNDLSAAVAELETTNLDSSAQEFIPGLPSYTHSFAITKWDKVVDDVLGPLAIAPALVTAVIAYKDASGDTLTYTWTTTAFVTGYTITAAANGKVSASGTLRLSGIPNRAAT